MDTALTVLLQVIIMFLLAFVGAVMFKTGKISSEGSKSIGNILIYLSLPAVIINGFLVERTAERLIGLGLSTALAAVSLLLSVLFARLFFKKDAVAQFAAAFSNPGFFGIPIIVSCLNSGAVFYIAMYIAFLNMGQWTHGVSLLRGEKMSMTPKKLVTAPFFIAIVIGLFFFLTGLTPPALISKTIGFLAGLNTPLAMFTVGIYLAQSDLKAMLKKGSLYTVSLVKLAIIPLATLAALMLVPAEYYEMKLAVLVAAACPTGSNIAVYAQLHNSDYTYAVETVAVTTVLSVVSLPLVVRLAEFLWMGI